MSEERSDKMQATAVMGTGDAAGIPQAERSRAEEPQRLWFIARVSPNTEKSTRTKLQALGYEAFVASQPELRFWKNGVRQKRGVVEKVVITQYLFLHLTRKEREAVIRYSFVKEFMKNRASHDGRDFALMSDADMQTLMQMFAQSDRPVLFDTGDYTVGEEVVLHLGSGEYTARVVRRRGDTNTYYGIRISELGCAYMEVPPAALTRQQA